MNKQRRKRLDNLAERITECMAELEALRDEEQEYFDNMPDSLQSTEKGEAAEQVISNLDEALEALQCAENLIMDYN